MFTFVLTFFGSKFHSQFCETCSKAGQAMTGWNWKSFDFENEVRHDDSSASVNADSDNLIQEDQIVTIEKSLSISSRSRELPSALLTYVTDQTRKLVDCGVPINTKTSNLELKQGEEQFWLFFILILIVNSWENMEILSNTLIYYY